MPLLSHRMQILYIADISLVVAYLELVPGCVVLESGMGSGSLTTSLAHAIAPPRARVHVRFPRLEGGLGQSEPWVDLVCR
jgi:tRNA A58 N-methylase Trm61